MRPSSLLACLFACRFAWVVTDAKAADLASTKLKFEIVSEWPAKTADLDLGTIFDKYGTKIPTPEAPGFRRISAVWVTNGIACVADGNALQILNVESPAHPKALARHYVFGSIEDVFIQGARAFIIDSDNSDYPAAATIRQVGLEIFDISAPVRPTKLNRESVLGNSHSSRFWVRNNNAYLLYLQLQRVDISVPAAPKLIIPGIQMPALGGNGCLDGDAFYYVGPIEGLLILDISEASGIKQRGRFPIPGKFYKGQRQLSSLVSYSSVAVGAGFAYLGRDGLLTVLNLEDLQKPEFVSATEAKISPGIMQVRGATLFVLDYWRGVAAFDVSNRAMPVMIGKHEIKESAGMCVDGDYVYLAGLRSLQILRVKR